MDEIHGYIERITFQNEENGFTVAKLQQPKHAECTCIVGAMPSVVPGETIRCFGTWKSHLVFGKQFEVKNYQIEAPADRQAIQKYLGSGLIKGIGPAYAKKIVDTFGSDTLNIIDSDPDRLKEVTGVGKKRIGQIKECWQEQRSIREVMIFLQNFGVSPTYAQKIFKTYGKRSIELLKENPYRLARDIFGIGFKSADTIAGKMGIEKDSPKRIDSGIEFVMSELCSNGHVCYPKDEFLIEASKVLEVPLEKITERLIIIQAEDRIVLKDLILRGEPQPYIWLKPLHSAEQGIGHQSRRLIQSRCTLRTVDIPKALDWVQKTLNITLAENQKKAVAMSLKEKMQIITGGPGTGKSTITNAILAITKKLTSNILLAAPTGRAAKRMTEITGMKACTIHTLLEFDFRKGGFKRNRENPLECDLIIIDEASMIDTLLMNSLLKAIPSHARIVFVGDINQLPSVGPGNVLRDLIDSGALPVTMLNEIFRQAAGSRIITNAHSINQGNFPDIRNIADSDFYFLECEEPEDVLKTIIGLVTQRLPAKFRYHPYNDIQVLAPMKRGLVGTESLNEKLQEALNPQKNPLIRFGKRLGIGDKVMQIKNNYQKEVFNGDVGRIVKIDPVEQQLIVSIDDKDILYDFSDIDELVLAYAVSIHKFQGSECPCVIIPVHTTHFKLLHKNLLYTGVTRGKKHVILVGTKRAISIAVHNDEVKLRHTGLKQALTELSHPTLNKVR